MGLKIEAQRLVVGQLVEEVVYNAIIASNKLCRKPGWRRFQTDRCGKTDKGSCAKLTFQLPPEE